MLLARLEAGLVLSGMVRKGLASSHFLQVIQVLAPPGVAAPAAFALILGSDPRLLTDLACDSVGHTGSPAVGLPGAVIVLGAATKAFRSLTFPGWPGVNEVTEHIFDLNTVIFSY